jgi:hypothetical protein
MQPLWFNDASEMTCLSEKTPNWTLNFNYWTGGLQQSCWGQWSWCSPDGPEPLKKGLHWMQGQPDNAQGNEGCIHSRVFKNSSGFAISDRNCSHKYVMACKVELISDLIDVSFFILTIVITESRTTTP